MWLSLGAAGRADAAEPIAPDAVKGALPVLDNMAQDAIRTGEVPGLAIAVVAGDEVVFLKGYGVREAGKPDAVGPDTVFQLASCSKPVASSVAAALVGQGHLTWDTRIAAIDPAFQLHDAYPTAEVTVRDLFAHRSRLPGNAGNDLESLGYTRAEILRRVHVLNPAGSFRAVYGYSNCRLWLQ